MPNSLNALNPVADINSIIEFVNNQTTLGGAPIAPEYFYSKQLLDTIRLDQDQYIYHRYADAQPIQERADKLLLRRWAPLQAHTVPLSEGVPPKSDKGSVEKYELEAFQYGRYMEFTDKVDFKAVDPVVAHYSKEYALVAMETMDMLARDMLLAVAQKYFAQKSSGGSPVVSMDDLSFDCTPKMEDLRKIQLSMKRQLVRPRNNGKYHVIGSPEFYFDMFKDPLVQQYMTINNTTKTMFDGGNAPIVPMFGFEFYETLVVPTSGEYYDEDGNKRLKWWAEGIPSNIISKGTGDNVCLDESEETEYEQASGYVKDSRTGADASYIPDQDVWTLSEGAKEFKVQHIFILGKDALARTGLSGQDAAKMYVKPLGSAGVLDPIDQRQSIGFKINSLGYGSLRPEAVVDYICVPTQANPEAGATVG